MSETHVDVGTSLLLVQADQATHKDLAAVAFALARDAEIRKNVALLGQMSKELPVETRQERALDFVNLLFSWTTPIDVLPGAVPSRFKPTKVFAEKASPAPTSKWHNALYIYTGKRGLPGRVKTFTTYAHSVVGAVEDLWAVRGYLMIPV